MNDFVISNLQEARNEWCSRLVSLFTPLVEEGMKSIFDEAWKMCVDNDEMNKYLMTFQNLLSRIPKWNSVIVEDERKRIIERSGCNYLEDLITCVHIIQLKVLTSIRVGNKQKKIEIQRFKGLGEMNPSQLRETTMELDGRRLLKLTLEKGNTSTSLMDMLLSKKRAGDRKNWLETKGDLASLNE